MGEQDTIIFAAGGTGGHIFPALAVADALSARAQNVKPVFLGVGKPIEAKLIAPKYQLEVLAFAPILGRGFAGVGKCLLSLPGAFFACWLLFRREKPRVVIGFGGYPSFVPLLVAFFSRVPTYLHEQNIRVGLANKFLSLFAKRIYAQPRARGFLAPSRKIVRMINPVRSAFETVSPWTMPKNGEKFVLLVVGGSQGAVTLNSAVLANVKLLQELNIFLIHIAGATDVARVTAAYQAAGYKDVEVYSFVDDIAAVYSRAHLVISRAGAMTAAEVVTAGRPAIFVPLAIAQAHQQQNIEQLLAEGAAGVVIQQDARGQLDQYTGADGEKYYAPPPGVLVEELGSEIKRLVLNPEELAEMATKARGISRQAGKTSARLLADQLCAQL